MAEMAPKSFLEEKNEALPVPISQKRLKERENPWKGILVTHVPYISLLTHSLIYESSSSVYSEALTDPPLYLSGLGVSDTSKA